MRGVISGDRTNEARASSAGGVRPGPRRRRSLALSLAAALLCLLPAGRSAAEGGGGASVSPREDRLLSVLHSYASRGRDPWDLHAALSEAGQSADEILAYVKIHTELEPYAGVLRGPHGTLAARAGGSLDRALLLRSLLELAGHRARVVEAPLDPEVAATRQRRFGASRAPERGVAKNAGSKAADRPSSDPTAALAAELGLDRAALDRAGASLRRESNDLVSEAIATARTEASRIERAVGARASFVPHALPLETHRAWVQVQDARTEGWRNLDPDGLAPPTGGGAPLSVAEIRKRTWRVSFEVVLHRTRDGKKETVTLLSAGAPLPAIAFRPVALVLKPDRGQLPPPSRLARLSDAARLEALQKVKVFRLGLIVDGRNYGGAPFDRTGATYKVGAGGDTGPIQGLGAAMRKVGGLLGGLGQPTPPKKKTLRLERVTLTVGLHGPGGERSRLAVRELLQTAQPGQTGRLPLARWSFLFTSHAMPRGERARRIVSTLDHNRAAIETVLSGRTGGPHPHLGALIPELLLRFCELRDRAVAQIAAAGAAPSRPLRGEPNAFCYSEQLWRPEKGAALRLQATLDLLHNDLAFVTAEGRADPRRALRAGVADTALESWLLVQQSPGATAQGAWNLLARDRLLGGEVSVETGDPGTPVGSPARDARLAIGWRRGGATRAVWVLDPLTGACCGRAPGGQGQAMVEYAWNIASQVCNYTVFLTMYAKTVGSKRMKKVEGVVSKVCSVVGGTLPRDMMMDEINKINDGLWQKAIEGLSGMARSSR